MSTVCFDFDGTLADYHGWQGRQTPAESPLAGAFEMIRRLMVEGYDIAICTLRDANEVREWLKQYAPDIADRIPVSREKPLAIKYVDDRGVGFTGDWEAAYRAIKEPTWWEQKQATRAERAKMIGKAIETESHEDPTVFAALNLYLSGEASYVKALETAVAALVREKTQFVRLIISLSEHQPPAQPEGSTA